jgi:hypothetical protein
LAQGHIAERPAKKIASIFTVDVLKSKNAEKAIFGWTTAQHKTTIEILLLQL